jgi:tRNA pseudouridine38-40 synthase
VARYRAVLAYDGTHYRGFQRQAGDTPTIQGSIEAAIAQVTGQPVSITGAGRTDSGVHATGQVIAFDVEWKFSTHNLWHAINALLPDAIALQSLDEAGAGFHPRYDAQSRTYEYSLVVAPVRQPLLSLYAWFVPDRSPLDLQSMRIAAASLTGVHDFATFGQPPQGENTIREVKRSELAVIADLAPEGQLIRYEIEANAFLYRMVRRIVAALIRVGLGKLSLDVFETAFRAADASWPNQTAPAHGLCLTKVTY